MTPPQPPSQTLREQIEEVVEWIDVRYQRAQFGDGNPNMVVVFHKLKAALAAQEASPPEIDCPLCGELVKQVSSATLGLALSQHIRWVCRRQVAEFRQRAWFEKGFQAGLNAIDKYGDQHQTLEEHYLAACRQEQP